MWLGPGNHWQLTPHAAFHHFQLCGPMECSRYCSWSVSTYRTSCLHTWEPQPCPTPSACRKPRTGSHNPCGFLHSHFLQPWFRFLIPQTAGWAQYGSCQKAPFSWAYLQVTSWSLRQGIILRTAAPIPPMLPYRRTWPTSKVATSSLRAHRLFQLFLTVTGDTSLA